jgi:RND family efflux transporter MFP subunit
VVNVDPVVVEPRFQTQPVVGRLVSRETSTLAAQTGSAVEAVHVDVGDRVEAGDILAELDTRRLAVRVALARAELAEREAHLAATEATVSLYRQELTRMEGLRDSAAYSQARFEDATAEVSRAVSERAQAEASLTRARAMVQQAQIDLNDTRIRAPFPGVVSNRDINVGEYVDVGDPILTLINDRELEVEAAVPSGLVGGLEAGSEVNAVLDDGTEFTATTRALIPREDTRTRTRRVRFTPDLPETAMPLAADQSAVVYVPIGAPQDALTVDKDAVISGPSGPVVYRVVDGHAELTPVDLGAAIGGRFEVTAGLEEGDLVVVRGNEGLSPGQPLQYEGL